ncbi:MAG: hypothetical protein AB7P34_22880 [Vicinamibacterales bacterium]
MATIRPILVLTGVCLLLIAIAVRTRGLVAASQPPLSLDNITSADIVEIRDAQGNAVLTGEFRTRVDTLGNTEKDAALRNRSGSTVIGEVELEIPVEGRENRRPELEVDVISLEPNQTYTVAIDDRPVATFITDDRGSIDVELQEGEV